MRTLLSISATLALSTGLVANADQAVVPPQPAAAETPAPAGAPAQPSQAVAPPQPTPAESPAPAGAPAQPPQAVAPPQPTPAETPAPAGTPAQPPQAVAPPQPTPAESPTPAGTPAQPPQAVAPPQPTQPSPYPQYGQPGPYPQYGQPGPYPQYGQPGPYPQYGQPGPYPQYGQPGAYPQYGQPGPYPQYGQPGAYPQYGQPGAYPQNAQPAPYVQPAQPLYPAPMATPGTNPYLPQSSSQGAVTMPFAFAPFMTPMMQTPAQGPQRPYAMHPIISEQAKQQMMQMMIPMMSNMMHMSMPDAMNWFTYKIKAKPGLSFDDVVQSMMLRANQDNFKFVGSNLMWKDFKAVLNDQTAPRIEVYSFCDIAVGRDLLRISPEMVVFLPCRIAVMEDADKNIWVLTLDWDLNWIAGYESQMGITPELAKDARDIRTRMLDIMQAAANGDL